MNTSILNPTPQSFLPFLSKNLESPNSANFGSHYGTPTHILSIKFPNCPEQVSQSTPLETFKDDN